VRIRPLIYDLASEKDWQDARRAGEYRISTRGRILEEGFIHCCQASQVAPWPTAFTPGSELEVVLLTIDTDRLRSEVRYEAAPGRELERRSALLQHTIYDCPNCEQRFLVTRRCPGCNLICRLCG